MNTEQNFIALMISHGGVHIICDPYPISKYVVSRISNFRFSLHNMNANAGEVMQKMVIELHEKNNNMFYCH